MINFTTDYFITMLLSLPGILIALTFHEMAHAFAADSMGDPTPRLAGRLTLNPLKHIDPIGFIAMLILRFGWAKPVPVNPLNFKDKKKGIILVSLAGILTNLLLAFLGMLFFTFVVAFGIDNEYLSLILWYNCTYNTVFAVFNLLPIPPLDGSRVISVFLSPVARAKYNELSRFGMPVLLILMYVGVFGMIITPIVSFVLSLFSNISGFLVGMLFGIIG